MKLKVSNQTISGAKNQKLFAGKQSECLSKGSLATPDLGVSLGSVDFKSLPEAISLSMVDGFLEVEVKVAVWLCEESKSPGPDDFNFNFIKSNWETLKKDIMEVVYLFQESGSFPKGCNSPLHCSCS